MKRRFRTSIAALATAVITMGSMVLTSGTASALDNMPGKPPSSCPGHVLSGFPLTKKVGSGNSLSLYVYYSSANGGTNCAIVKKSGSWKSKKTYLDVHIWKDNVSAESGWPDGAWDQGNYYSYAGAAYITHTNGKCIDVISNYGLHKDDWNGQLHRIHFACK